MNGEHPVFDVAGELPEHGGQETAVAQRDQTVVHIGEDVPSPLLAFVLRQLRNTGDQRGFGGVRVSVVV